MNNNNIFETIVKTIIMRRFQHDHINNIAQTEIEHTFSLLIRSSNISILFIINNVINHLTYNDNY